MVPVDFRSRPGLPGGAEVLFNCSFDARLGCSDRIDLAACSGLDFVHCEHIGGIGHRDSQTLVDLENRNQGVLSCNPFRD